ncbi:MAG: CsgG/HfaB family protein [Kiritimatiellae bacterium]|nr:CsgG/HfaB family protein [Kiritimatiellia bacterium]
MRLKDFVWLLAATLAPASWAYEKEIRSMAGTLADSIAKSGKKTIAVVDFTDLQGNVTELGRFLAEELSVALASTGKGFEVVDRTHLKAILAEHKLASTGVIDPATARKLGQITGVEALVTGTITSFGDSVRLTVKCLDTATAKVILAAATDIPKTKAVEELLSKSIQDTSQPVGTPGPAQPAPQSPVRGTAVGRPASVLVAQFKNLSFEVRACIRQAQSITCHVMITSADLRGELLLLGRRWRTPSRMIDERGVEYQADRVLLGSETGSSAEVELVPEVPMRATVVFDQVPEDIKSVAVLELRGNFTASRLHQFPFQVSFRTIPISR